MYYPDISRQGGGLVDLDPDSTFKKKPDPALAFEDYPDPT